MSAPGAGLTHNDNKVFRQPVSQNGAIRLQTWLVDKRHDLAAEVLAGRVRDAGEEGPLVDAQVGVGGQG